MNGALPPPLPLSPPPTTLQLGGGFAEQETSLSPVFICLLEDTELDLAPHQENLHFPDCPWHRQPSLSHGEHSLLCGP